VTTCLQPGECGGGGLLTSWREREEVGMGTIRVEKEAVVCV
jgi:hypothetical protein